MIPRSKVKTDDLSDCPYYRDTKTGKCSYGCWTEPSCFTDEPIGGWPSKVRSADEKEAQP